MKKTITLFFCALACLCAQAEETPQRYVGGDISALPLYEKHNSPYKDVYGNNISDLITFLTNNCGWNTFRVRIFVNPTKKDHGGTSNPSVCQDLAYVKTLGKRIKDAGAFFMLDFHYSDTWVDATHIQAPAAWKGKSDAVMADSVAKYTRRVLDTLNAVGATPDLVQVGNEIMYGMCGIKVHPKQQTGDNWDGFLGLLNAGCNAVREKCPNAQIIIHTDRPTNISYNNFFYSKLIAGNVDFDIIGLSYYPFWHGYLTDAQVASKSEKNNLVAAINNLNAVFPTKRVHIVECAYNFQHWPSTGVNYDTQDVWPCTVAGQYAFVRDLVDALKPLTNVDGINYWFPEEAGNGDDTNWNTSKGSVIPSWQNRGFWKEEKSTSGHAINKTATATSGRQPQDVCAPYYMRAFVSDFPEALEQTSAPTLHSEKRMENGDLIIRIGDREYNASGMSLK